MQLTLSDQLEAIKEELADLRVQFPKPEPRVYKPEDLAEMLGVSRSHVIAQCAKYADSKGTLGWPHRRPSPKIIVFLPEDIDAILNR